MIRKKYVHIGFAVDTPDGLLVPVIRDVDRRACCNWLPRPLHWPRKHAPRS